MIVLISIGQIALGLLFVGTMVWALNIGKRTN